MHPKKTPQSEKDAAAQKHWRAVRAQLDKQGCIKLRAGAPNALLKQLRDAYKLPPLPDYMAPDIELEAMRSVIVEVGAAEVLDGLKPLAIAELIYLSQTWHLKDRRAQHVARVTHAVNTMPTSAAGLLAQLEYEETDDD